MSQWSKLKKQLDSMLCDGLRGKITYNVTQYRKAHDDHGKGAIRVDGKDVFIASDVGLSNAIWIDYDKMYDEFNNKTSWFEEISRKYGMYDEFDFFRAAYAYLNQSIEKSLKSDNIIENIFALLDRRVGKRTLKKIENEIQSKNKIVLYFYNLRCEVEKINKDKKHLKIM